MYQYQCSSIAAFLGVGIRQSRIGSREDIYKLFSVAISVHLAVSVYGIILQTKLQKLLSHGRITTLVHSQMCCTLPVYIYICPTATAFTVCTCFSCTSQCQPVPGESFWCISSVQRGLTRDHIPVKDLVFHFAFHTGTDPAKSSPDQFRKPLKRFKMSFSQFEGFCLVNPVQGRLQASRPLLCC